MTDIVFLTLPRLELRAPITAPAILKAVVEKNGFSAFCYDLNLDLWLKLDEKEHGHIWFDTDLTFRYKDHFKKFWNDHILPIAYEWVETIKEKSPKWIGITVFSQRSRHITFEICRFLKKELPEIKIVLGGPQAAITGKECYKEGLSDAYVVGEGEEAILNILNNNFDAPGINGNPPQQINDLSNVPIPDYSDFHMDKYTQIWYDPRIKDEKKLGTKSVYITGSRGCVRKCTFCDIISMWPKYRYRSGEHIANEIKEQYQKYNVDHFLFTDSLINGSVKQLKDLCNTLIEYKSKNLIGNIKCQGQFIARPKHQMTEEVYELMSKAGVSFVGIGVESGSEKVRDDMKKMFDNDALDFTFRMCAKHNIEMFWLLMVGYPTETEEDFQKTLDMLEKYQWINETGLVRSVFLGATLDILEGAPLYHMQNEMGITWDHNNHWVYNGLTKEERIERWLRLKEKCLELNYNIIEKETDHFVRELEMIRKNKKNNGDVGPMGPTI